MDSDKDKNAIPFTETEAKLASIWEGILKKKVSRPDSNFFHLGGHSLAAALMVARIREELKTEVPLRIILQNPTIRQLAREIMFIRLKHIDDSTLDPLLEVE